ncbi:MAG: alpha/beta hydrolase domain-containing protein [Holophaga sp.]|nr:alpha/beta hydrolase domain-containing protein [Holophaga sp.]
MHTKLGTSIHQEDGQIRGGGIPSVGRQTVILGKKRRLRKFVAMASASVPIAGIAATMAFTVVALALMSGCGGSSGSPAPVTAAKTYANVPTPTATLIPSDTIGSADHNYTFFAMDMNLAKFGYVEQEFFIDGTGNTYDTPAQSGGVGNTMTTAGSTANVLTTGNPYRTRIVVYRPTDSAKFNGTAIVEWQNVTNGYDTPVQWFQQKDFVLRNGYAWVEVSAQSGSITNSKTGLQVWSPTRYSTLDVTNGGKISADLLSYDIFGQAAKAVRSVPAVLGGLQVKKLIAIGNSQSAGRVGIYLNGVQSLHQIFDGAILVVGGPKLRTDLGIPIIKALSESEMTSITNETPVLQDDTDNLVTWQISGTSHSEIYGAAVRGTMLLRDLNLTIGEVGGVPTRSRIPYRYVHNNAISKIENYIDKGTALPRAPSMIIVDPSVPSVAKDSDGNVLSGLRLPDINVPIARDNGNTALTGITPYIGEHVPFTMARLGQLYTNHDDYVQKFTEAANTAVASGYMLQEDALEDIANAKASIIGEGMPCDSTAPLVEDISEFPKLPSILTLRMQLYVYNIADRPALLETIDAATREIASGYLITDATLARVHYAKAITLLQGYITQVQAEATTVGSISQATSDYLVGQANTLIAALQVL